MKKLSILLLLASLVFTSFAQADGYVPSPYCTAPKKPLIFSPKYYQDRYTIDVQKYKNCLMDFVREQEEAVRIHKLAAENATKEWNHFVGKQ